MASSIDTYAIIGITISASFVVFSLGVLVAICMVKRRSKGIPVVNPPIYETVGLDQMQIAVEANSSYEIATNKDTVEQPYYLDLHV